MRNVIGLAVGEDGVRAVAVRGGRIVWAAESSVDEPGRVGDAVAEILAKVPGRRLRRPPVVVAFGPSSSQLRVVSGLPAVEDPKVLSRMIQQSPSRFFLRNGAPLVTSRVQALGPGRVLAAAFDQPVLHAVLAGCQAARYRTLGVVPAAAVLDAALVDERIMWADGSALVEIERSDGDLTAVKRRAMGPAERIDPPRPCEALARIGDGAWRFADAYGAAVRVGATPLFYRPDRSARPRSPARAWRARAAAFVAAVAFAFAMLGPGLAAQQRARTAEARLLELAEARNTAVAAEAQLARFTEVLADVTEFERNRASVTLLLAGITRALPSDHALVSLRVDSAGVGTIVAVAPRAAGVVALLEDVPAVTSPRILGPVTRERIGAAEVERVTVQFEVARSGSMHADIEGEEDGR